MKKIQKYRKIQDAKKQQKETTEKKHSCLLISETFLKLKFSQVPGYITIVLKSGRSDLHQTNEREGRI